MAWNLAEEMGLTGAAMIAVFVNPPHSVANQNEAVMLSADTKLALARLWVPPHPEIEGFPDLGHTHRLSAMILFKDSSKHYVVLCRRHGDPSRCRLFNDIPDTTVGAPSEMAWSNVPTFCYEYGLLPRYMIYESAICASVSCKLQGVLVSRCEDNYARTRAHYR